MTQQEIFTILETNIKKHKQAVLFCLILAILFFIPGVLMYLKGEGDTKKGGIALACCGLFFLILWLALFLSKSLEKSTEQFKNAMIGNPKDFLWVYVAKQTKYGQEVSSSVVVNFSNGKVMQVGSTSIPNKDINGFVDVIVALNPDVHLGYSEELAYKFKKKTL